MTLEEICMLSEKSINEIVDSGMLNSVIKGYVLLALDEDISLNDLFDTFSAEDARERYNKS